MSAEPAYFVDANVLLYEYDAAEPEKRERAAQWIHALWESGRGRISWQALNEFYSVSTRKLKASPRVVRPVVEAYMQWEPAGISFGLVQQAWSWMDRASLSYWDALILAAAEHTGCRFLLSEDFQDGRDFGGVRVVNPFRMPPPAS